MVSNHSLACFYRSTAPNPYAVASSTSFVSVVLELYQARIGEDVSSVLVLLCLAGTPCPNILLAQ